MVEISMRERLARVIAQALPTDDEIAASGVSKDDMRKVADAVLDAMREPTPIMEQAASAEMDRHEWPFGEHHAAKCWQLMIDHARNNGKG